MATAVVAAFAVVADGTFKINAKKDDVYKYKVRQTFGVAAIDFRGLYKHAGA